MRFLVSEVCLVFILACIGLGLALAQQGEDKDVRADSLSRMLGATADYDEQVRLLGELSDYYSYRDSAKAMDYALQIKALAQKRNDQRGVGIAHFRIGGVHFERYQVDSAITHYQLAEQLLEKDTSFLGQQYLARSWYNHGAQYQRKGDDETFMDVILNRSIPIYERIGDSLGMGRNFHNIGIVFQNREEFDRAIFYHRKAIAMLTGRPHTPQLVDAYIKLAEAIVYLPDLDATKRAEAKDALNRADSLLKLYPDNYSYLMYLNTMGMFEEVFGERLDDALALYLKGHALAEEYQMPVMAKMLLNRAYYIYDKRGEHQLALSTVKRIMQDYNTYMMSRDQLVQLRNLMNSYEKLGSIPEAFRVQKAYIVMNDSLHKAETAYKIHNLEQRFAAKEKETQIARLHQQMQAQELRAQRNRLWTTLLAVGILLLVGVSFAGYNIFRKKQLIAKQQAELMEQDMKKMRQEQHISVFSAMLEGQEQERKRLAIDLHDGLGGSLSSIKMKLSKVVQTGNGVVWQTELPAVVNQLDESVGELRRIARNLMPETLLKYGLAMALRDFCKSLEQDDIKISCQSYGLRDNMPKSIQIMVYRIVQELISNAIKHAKPTHILAQCLQNDNQLSITVEDDGVGFDSAKLGGLGMGLSNVRTRVAYMGGKLDIHSEQGIGTTVTIELTYADEYQVH